MNRHGIYTNIVMYCCSNAYQLDLQQQYDIVCGEPNSIDHTYVYSMAPE